MYILLAQKTMCSKKQGKIMDVNSKIYVVTHKPFILSKDLKQKGYELITVGNNNRALQMNTGVTDRTRNSIFEKNANYCELTAAYWIWKNINSDIKGFCHYRRYFSKPTFRYDVSKIISLPEVRKVLNNQKRKTIILPKRRYYDKSSKDLYLECGYEKDLLITRDVISEKYPEYLNEFNNMLEKNTGYLTNMMIAKADIYNAYCSWLFDILFEVEKRSDLTSYSIQEARIFGYLSERLVDVWVTHNDIDCIEYQNINTEQNINIKYRIGIISERLGLYKNIKDILFHWRKIRNN